MYVVWGMLENFLFGGIFFGWGSLVFTLKEEGFYLDLCDDNISSPDLQNKSGGQVQDSHVRYRV